MSSDSLYRSSAEVLSICQSIKDNLEAVLDPDTGYAPRMRQICHEYIEELEDEVDSRSLRDEIEVLRLEKNTWGLLQAVMPPKTEQQPKPSARDLLLENPYIPTSTLAQSIIQASRLLTELLVVREWLQETAPTPSLPEANTGYWKFTKHTIMQGIRTGQGPRDGLVQEMDPDAVNKGDGAGLAADDASYEKSLLQALYGYVRAGRLGDAMEVSRRAHQPWRAASLRGSLLFNWKAISTEPHDEDASDDEEELEGFTGNPNRTLWKLTYQERLLYASISPSFQTISILKSGCRTWEDHLWSDISVMCEERASKELARLAKWSFWEGGLDALEKGVPEVVGGDAVLGEQSKTEETEWEKEVRGTLDALKSVNVIEGPPADHAFHFSQLYIILDQTDSLLTTFSQGLKSDVYRRDTSDYQAMCRFFTHLSLFLQMIGTPTPPEPTHAILEAYIKLLEDNGERDLVALYAAALGVNAVKRYSLFLVSLGLTADFNERRQALTRASQHGLDVLSVARTAAQDSIRDAFKKLPKLQESLPLITERQPPPNDAEMLLLRSIEWTTFMPQTYQNALEHATVILRYFLGAGRIQAAQNLLDLLPPELASIDDPEEIATEYLHYRQFFLIWDSISQVTEWQAQEGLMTQGPGATREAKQVWLAEYRNLIDQAHDKILRLLTTEWLTADDFELSDPKTHSQIAMEQRANELGRIRQIFVPELVLRLHHLLYSSRRLIPENLKRALELANVVADARYNIYNDFTNKSGRTLPEYLLMIRRAVLAGLESGGSDPFRIISA
ncbi:nuclear pore protein 84/107 [Gymnopilus junonius]|uniref:Nuclear pore complex protein n=1 Tax=Gymnopilus junonius TaxID=109634 RepID=A0A9P5NPY4_GYMJU|nr:nuclear pore protein 84/107 [Gymnopilus junonius]